MMLLSQRMDGLKAICAILCVYGFFKSMRPSEAFLTQYLMGPWVNLTEFEINAQAYPVATYSYLVVLFIVLLITDFLRYKPIILLEALTLIGTYVLLIWGRTLQTVQVVEFLYAVSCSCEIAYYTYIYAKVTGEHYQKVTSYTRSAVLGGFFLSGVIGQVLVSTDAMNFYDLNFLTLSSAIVAFIIAIFLPKVTRSIYFHQDAFTSKRDGGSADVRNERTLSNGSTLVSDTSISQTYGNGAASAAADASVQPEQPLRLREKIKLGFRAILADVKYSYTKSSVVKWSIWWACGTCLNLQIAGYIQPLWEVIYPSSEHKIYNGAVESIQTLLGSLAALGIGFVHINWSHHGEWLLCVVSLLDAVCLFIMAITTNIWIAYVTYIFFRVAYQVIITIASFQVAKDLRDDTHGLIFGCNTFLALFLQTILVAVVTDEKGLAATSRLQFKIYAGCSLALALIFLAATCWVCCRRRNAADSYNVEPS